MQVHPDIYNCSAIKQLLEDIRADSVRTPQPYRGLCAATVSRDAVTYSRVILGSTMDTEGHESKHFRLEMGLKQQLNIMIISQTQESLRARTERDRGIL